MDTINNLNWTKSVVRIQFSEDCDLTEFCQGEKTWGYGI